MPALDAISTFVDTLDGPSIPTNALTQAASAFRDTLGTMLGGTATTSARIAAEVARRDVGPVALVAGGTSSSGMAAFANAVAASALDYDDGHYRGGAIHPASVIVPTLLATALPGVTMDEFLVAHVAGVEVAIRAAYLLWPRHPDGDYHCTGTAAAMGAAAAGAKVRGLDADGVARAIATAWAHAPMSAFQLPMVKEAIGWSAATAVTAVNLAEAGFMRYRSDHRPSAPDVFPPTPFDRPGAMQDPFVDTWGTVFEVANTYFKPFAACRYTHAAAGGLRTFMSEQGLGADDIESIEVGTFRSAVFLDNPRPPTLEHAQYSFQFVLAAIAVHGAAGSGEMSEARLDDEAMASFCDRTTVSYASDLDELYPARYPARLAIIGRDGSRSELLCEIAPGDSEVPLTADQLRTKFVELAAPSLGAAEATSFAADLDEPSGPVADLVARAYSGSIDTWAWSTLHSLPRLSQS